MTSRIDQILSRKDQHEISVQSRDILCFMCVRNESLRLPYCLSYYRRLGISRFFIVENNSTDDTLPWLLAQSDVHVWHTGASFGAARCGTDWIELLLREYGLNHWCLIVDADELLCYPDSETRRLEALCADLDQQGNRAFLAILLDMYSDKPIKDTHYHRGRDFLEACPYFDRQFYHFKTDNFFGHNEHTSYFGGLRQRVFGGREPGKDGNHFYCVNKIPLIKYDPSMVLSDNLHWTSCKEVAAETGCLLHFKYFSSFLDQAREEAERQEHWNHAAQYAQYARTLAHSPDLALFSGEGSIRFGDTAQLVELGIMHKAGRAMAAMKAETVNNGASHESQTNKLEVAQPIPKLRNTSALVRQVRDLIRTHKKNGEHPHETGIALFKEGDLEGATAAFRQAIELNPHFAWSHHNLGDVLARRMKWDEALAAFRRALELNPHFALSYSKLGDVLIKQQKWEEAVAANRRALQLQPDLAAAAKGLARALAGLAQTHIEEAKLWYRHAHKLNPDDPEIYGEAVDLRPVDPDLCVQLADALVTRNQSTKAIFFYQLALLARPDDAWALIKLGKALKLEKEVDQAIACCHRAIALDGDQAGYYKLLGDLFADQERLEEATEAYQKASELDATNAAIPKRLGDLLARRGRIDEASRAYQRAIELGYKNF